MSLSLTASRLCLLRRGLGSAVRGTAVTRRGALSRGPHGQTSTRSVLSCTLNATGPALVPAPACQPRLCDINVRTIRIYSGLSHTDDGQQNKAKEPDKQESSEQKFSDVNYEEVLAGCEQASMQFLDCRRPDELAATGRIGDAFNVPVEEMAEGFQLSDKDFQARYGVPRPDRDAGNLVVYCRSGKRAITACNQLADMGYTRIKRYPGSWLEWQEKYLDPRTGSRDGG